MTDAFDVGGLAAVIYKEFRHIVRDPTTLALIIALPIMQLLIYGYALNLHVQHVQSLYVDEDRGRYSATLVRALGKSPMFAISAGVGSEADLERALVAGRARVGFIVPKGFSRAIAAGRSADVSMLVDGSDAAVAQAAYEGARAVSDASRAYLDPLDEGAVVDIRPRTLFNPSLRSTNFLVPGLIGLVMQNVTMVLTALSVINEREHGTLEQMRAMPIGSGAVMLGKIIPYGAVAFLDVLLVLVTMRVVFGVPIAGNTGLLLLLCVPFLMTGLGLGLFVSTIARSQPQAILMTVFFLMASFLLCGFFFEIDQMPEPARIVSDALPMTYFLQILRGIILRGAGIGDLWIPAVVTVAFGVGSLTIASLRFASKSS